MQIKNHVGKNETWGILVCVCVSHHCTVVGVFLGFDDAELVEHLTDDDDADPNGGQT